MTEDKKLLYFHDQERADLFFIRLNEFLNTQFKSPLNPKTKTSIFDLMREFCLQYKDNEVFDKFLYQIDATKDFFFKKRFYQYYISPFDIDFEISFSELINFQSNNSKHSYYHLSIIKDKLKKHFKKNNIPNYEQENYNDHLEYFQEAVLDDRLNFNQTHMVEKLGTLFLSFWDLVNSNQQQRIRNWISNFIEENGKLAPRKIDKPEDLTSVEEFYWEIKGMSKFKRERLSNFIPETSEYLIEKETSRNNMIEKHR